MSWLTPWEAAEDTAAGVEELRRELPASHVLFRVPVHALAYRQDRDDFLFALDDGTHRVAAVHLTYNVEHNPLWPDTEIFASLEEFRRTRMLGDHEELMG
jgi:hypothetical protein